MTSSRFGIKNLIYSSLFLIFVIAIYALQQAAPGSPPPIAPRLLSQKIHNIYADFTHSLTHTAHQLLSLLELKKSYIELQHENQSLKASLQIIKESENENARLKKILSYKEENNQFQFIIARVTAKDLFTDHYSLFINKGSRDGVEKMAGVISPDGVVGYIIDVGENSSRLLLVNDRLSSIDAVIQRTRARGIVSGYTHKDCQLKYIDRPQEITQGDAVVTAGDQTQFPQGYPIGTIHHIKINPTGVGHLALLKPTVDFRKLEEVMILKPAKNNVRQ